jgi:creatinine amidohydrolase
MGSRYWQDLTTTDFDGLDPAATVALFPVAAIEQHGPHLPLSTDTVINRAIVSEALKLLPEHATVLVLPTMTVGDSLEHSAFPGTLTIEPETLLLVWKAIGSSVFRAGIRKLVIFNSHGGQTALVDLAALRLRVELQMFVVRANYFALGMPPGLFEEKHLANDLHGGEVETSLMLHLRPDLVRKEAVQDFRGLPGSMGASNELLGPEKPVGFGWMSQDLNPAGACGNAANADPERGATYLDYLARRLAALLMEVIETPLSVIDQAP